MAEAQDKNDNNIDEDYCVICKLGFKNETPTTVSGKGMKTLPLVKKGNIWSY